MVVNQPLVRRYTCAIVSDVEFSPRLSSLETASADAAGAPLLPPPQQGAEAEDRFCTAGPKIEGPGSSRQGIASASLEYTFPDLVGRLEASMGQASLLLSDRIRALKNKFKAGSKLTPAQEVELCEIADAVSAASYNVAKWAFLLRSKSEGGASKPSKPARSESSESAFAAVHFALPRLMVNIAEAHRGLQLALRTHGDEAEQQLKTMGVPPEDIRALAPHLERILLRLGRLSSAVRLPPNTRHFIPQYFAPAIGEKPARLLLQFI